MPSDFFPAEIPAELVSRIWGIKTLSIFYRCMSGNSYFRDEKTRFFGGDKLIKFPKRGKEYNMYKVTKLFRYNTAIFANGILLAEKPSKERLVKLNEDFTKIILGHDLKEEFSGLTIQEVEGKPLPAFLPLLEAGSTPPTAPLCFPVRPGHMVKFLPISWPKEDGAN